MRRLRCSVSHPFSLALFSSCSVEYASMFNTLPNCKVTIIDERPSFLDFIDHEVIDALKYVMRRKGATVRDDTRQRHRGRGSGSASHFSH